MSDPPRRISPFVVSGGGIVVAGGAIEVEPSVGADFQVVGACLAVFRWLSLQGFDAILEDLGFYVWGGGVEKRSFVCYDSMNVFASLLS